MSLYKMSMETIGVWIRVDCYGFVWILVVPFLGFS